MTRHKVQCHHCKGIFKATTCDDVAQGLSPSATPASPPTPAPQDPLATFSNQPAPQDPLATFSNQPAPQDPLATISNQPAPQNNFAAFSGQAAEPLSLRHKNLRKPKQPNYAIPIITILALVSLAVGIYFMLHTASPLDKPEPEEAPVAPTGPTRTGNLGGVDLFPDTPSDDELGESGASNESGETKEPVAAVKASHIETQHVAFLNPEPEVTPQIVGHYENTSDHVVASVQFVATIRDPKGHKTKITSQLYRHIPPGFKGKFSFLPEFTFDEGMTLEGVVTREIVDKTRDTGWAMDKLTLDIGEEAAEGKIFLSGEAKNIGERSIRNIVIWCDIFTKSGLYAGSAKGTLEDNATKLRSDGELSYKIVFDTETCDFAPQVLRTFFARIVAKQD